MQTKPRQYQPGFTIVELLIVIVVIGVLASIVVVAYSGIQQQARDSIRKRDVASITKALEMYYIDNGTYPPGSCSSGCVINTSWSNTNDGSWQNLATYLVPKYISSLPVDPSATTGSNPLSSVNHGYAYFSNNAGTYCGSPANQVYILVYDLELGSQQNTLNGACTTSPIGPYGGKSNYRTAIGGS